MCVCVCVCVGVCVGVCVCVWVGVCVRTCTYMCVSLGPSHCFAVDGEDDDVVEPLGGAGPDSSVVATFLLHWLNRVETEG